MVVFDPSLYDPTKAVTVDPKTGLITGSPDHRAALQRHGHSRQCVPEFCHGPST